MSKRLSVSLPDDLADETSALALAQGKTRSEVVRDALRRHLRREQLFTLQQYGQEQAEVRGIGPDDVEALIDAGRAEAIGSEPTTTVVPAACFVQLVSTLDEPDDAPRLARAAAATKRIA